MLSVKSFPVIFLFILGLPVNAATIGNIEGKMTIPYECEVSVPGLKELDIDPHLPQATSTDAWNFRQNDVTIYTLTPLTIIHSNEYADVTVRIDLEYTGSMMAAPFSLQATTSIGSDANVWGNLATADDGVVKYTLIEQKGQKFFAGDYAMIATLSCYQALTRIPLNE